MLAMDKRSANHVVDLTGTHDAAQYHSRRAAAAAVPRSNPAARGTSAQRVKQRRLPFQRVAGTSQMFFNALQRRQQLAKASIKANQFTYLVPDRKTSSCIPSNPWGSTPGTYEEPQAPQDVNTKAAVGIAVLREGVAAQTVRSPASSSRKPQTSSAVPRPKPKPAPLRESSKGSASVQPNAARTVTRDAVSQRLAKVLPKRKRERATPDEQAWLSSACQPSTKLVQDQERLFAQV